MVRSRSLEVVLFDRPHTSFYSPSIVNIWNSLPNYVVDAQSIDVFKVRLDKFWAQQEVMLDWTADLTGTGDRSEYTVD